MAFVTGDDGHVYLAISPQPTLLSTFSSFICVLSGADVDRCVLFCFHIVPMTIVIVEHQRAKKKIITLIS